MSRHQMTWGAIGLGLALCVGGAVWFTLPYFHSAPSTSSAQNPTAEAQPRKAKAKHAPPQDPLVTAMASAEQDDALVQWLDGWSGHPAGAKASPEQLQQLQAILDHTPLHSAALFTIAHEFHSNYTAPAATLIFYQAAAAHAHEELAAAQSPAEISKILSGMMHNRQDFNRVLTPLIEENRDPQALDTLCSIYTDFMRYLPPGDKKLAKIVQTDRTEIAECYFLKGQSAEALALFKESDPDLVQWFGDWTAASGQPPKDATPDQLHHLADILTRTDLRSHALFDLADAFHSSFATAPLASETLYAAAAQHAHRELAENKDSKNEVANILHAIVRNREDFKHLTWPLIDTRNPQAIDTLYTLYSDVLNYAPPKDATVAKFAPSELQLGIAECLFLKGDLRKPLALVKELASDNSLPPVRRASLEWFWVLILQKQGNYSEAVDHLQELYQNDAYPDQNRVFNTLFELAIRAHRPNVARSALDSWLQKNELSIYSRRLFESQIAQCAENKNK